MENKTRGAPRDVIRAYYENNYITLKKLSEKFGVSYNTIKSWKNRDDKEGTPWTQPEKKEVATETKKVAEVQNKSQALSKAKSMVISGETFKKASEETGISTTTLENHSSREKWLESRKAYNNYIYRELISELGKQHLKDRKNAVTMSRVIGLKVFQEMQQGELSLDKVKMYKEVANIVEKTISVAGKMLGITDIDKFEVEEADMNINIVFEEEGQDGS